MEFILNDYHRNLSEEELLSDLKRVASMLNQNTLSREEYRQHGKYSYTTYQKRFGGWNKSLDLAGLGHTRECVRNDLNRNVTNEELLADLKLVAQMLSKDTLTTSEYNREGKHGSHILLYRFTTWEKALKLAGLKPTGFHHAISDDDLLLEIARLWMELGRQPTSTDIRNGLTQYSLNSYTRRFGGWRNALSSFVIWANSSDTVQLESKPNNNCISANIASESDKTPLKPPAKRNTKRDINYRLRFKVMQRDHFTCCACGASPAKDPSVVLHVDHIIPWAKGGETTMDNLQTLCSKCNLGKSDLDFG